ncbi:MAG: response regulator [Treponema sp.]|jgi:signal transduction histidine kinase/ActR/RegA family two-component response regulator|nr:response regulator [Treponema sp.]
MGFVIMVLAALGISGAATVCVYCFLHRRFSGRLRQQQAAAEALGEKLLQQELMAALTQSFISSDDTGVLIHNALMMLAMSMKVSRAVMARLDQKTNIIAFEYEWSDPRQRLQPLIRKGAEFTKGELFYDTFVIRGDVNLICDNVDEDPCIARAFVPRGVKSCVFVPINVWGQFWGVLGIEQCTCRQVWKEADIRILKLVSGAVTSLLIRAEAEKVLVKAKEAAEISNRAKSNFLSRMSHEMRTPLNAVIGMTTIARNSRSQEKMEYCLGKISEASLHLLGVINDILDMSKIEAGKFELSNTEFDFERMLKRVTDMIEFKVNEKRQRFIARFDPAMPAWIIADEQRLAQVLTNLLSNAVKFTPERGSITLSARMTGGAGNSRVFRFDVTDSGIGVTEEQKARLFAPFEQADGSVSRKFGGTGLGLSISKNIVEMMGGRIWLESEPGKGSNFAFEITAEPGKGSDKQAAPHNRQDLPATAEKTLAGIFAGHTILLVEDVEINREIITTLLEETGVAIDRAEDGGRAVKLFTENPAKYALILMDIHMPEMNGYEATMAIRALGGEGAQIPIIAMTANVFKEDIDHCLASGMNDHLGKPIELDVLIKRLRRYLLGEE